MPQTQTLIVALGDVPSLAALCLETRSDQTIAWHPQYGAPNAGIRARRASAAAEFFGLEPITIANLGQYADTAAHNAAMLLSALLAARQRNVQRIVWPVTAGDDHALAVHYSEIAILIESIAALDGAPQPRIVMPLLEMTPPQILEIIEHSAAPITLAWRCEHGDDQECGQCESCTRWSLTRQGAAVSV